MSGPRLGVMSFSLGGDLWRRRISVEGMIAAIASLGPGQELELIGSHALRGFPDPDEAEVAALRSMIEDHGVVASVYCADLDRGRTTGAMLSPQAALQLVEREAALARALGFQALRVSPAGPDLVPDLARLAERLGIPVLVEHGAEPRTDPHTADLVEAIARHGEGRVGLIADGSAFVRRLPQPWKQACLDGGVPTDALDLVVQSWDPEQPLPEVMGALHGLGLDTLQLELSVYALMTTRFLFRKGDVAGLLDMLPHVHHLQTKFFATGSDGADPCVPYDEIVPLLRDAGFSGGLHAEYEGGIWSAGLDTVAELRRHQGYLRRLWGDGQA
jgi:hypothetical protein